MATSTEVCANTGNAAVTTGVRRWFDVQTAADYCQVKVKTLRRAYKAGKVPRARMGRKFIFDRRDLDAWLQGELIREN